MVTGAFVGAVQIDTASMEADFGEHTLIHIWKEGRVEEKGPQKIKRQLLTLCSLFINLQWFNKASVEAMWRNIYRAVTLGC